MPKLVVMIGSTRPGRAGLPIAEWFVARAQAHGAFDVQVVDLAELNLPFFNEPNHPRLRKYVHQHTKDWSATIDAMDALVIVTPEYNYGYGAPVKNAIDYLHEEWKNKPVGFVSYGGVAAGTRAVQQLKQVVTALALVPTVASVNIPFVTQFLDDNREIQPNPVMTQAATDMLDELLRLEQVLAPLRAAAEH